MALDQTETVMAARRRAPKWAKRRGAPRWVRLLSWIVGAVWRWHLDEVFVRINGETHYLWRAVDHEGEVPEVYATKRRDRRAALKFLKRTMKRYGRPRSIVTDRLRSYRSAMNVIGNAADQECGRWLNNRAENSHQPFRRREGAMAKFRDVKTLQKFAAAHASIHNHSHGELLVKERFSSLLA